MTVTFYIYALVNSERTFYIGCSRHPKIRLKEHKYNTLNPPLRELAKDKKTEIEILDKIIVQQKMVMPRKDALRLEDYWIKKHYELGHPLINKYPHQRGAIAKN